MSASLLGLVFCASIVAAAVSGAAGFGGALLLLPLLTRLVGPELAVPLLTIAQLVGNLARALFGVRSIAWRLAAVFLAPAIPAAIAGSFCFVALPRSLLTRAIGIAILAFVVARWRGALRFEMTRLRLALAGAVVGFVSGLVGSAGPLGAAAFLALDLAPVAYIATEATSAVVMHAVKMAVYGHHVRIDSRAWAIASALALGMVAGTWLGMKTVERVSARTFRAVVGALLVALALQMIVAG